MNFSTRQAVYMGILVIVLLLAWQSNFARKSNAVLNGGNFAQHENGSSIQRRNLKFYIAFRYWEQLTQATNNLIALTALASYSGHQVVVPFVIDSHFFGNKMKNSETLALYYLSLIHI